MKSNCCRPSSRSRPAVWLARFAAAVVCLCAVVARAHGPFDSSAELIIGPDSLEARAVLGMDGAKQVLLSAGLSEAEAASALTVRGPATLSGLSSDLAPGFFELTAGGKTLKAERLRVVTDGLEASFSATYAGAYSGDLEFRARYFEKVEAMKPGGFVAMDENRNVRSSAMLSRSQPGARVALPAPARMTDAKPGPAPAPPVAATNVNPTVEQPATKAGSTRSFLPWMAGVVVIAFALLALLRFRRRA